MRTKPRIIHQLKETIIKILRVKTRNPDPWDHRLLQDRFQKLGEPAFLSIPRIARTPSCKIDPRQHDLFPTFRLNLFNLLNNLRQRAISMRSPLENRETETAMIIATVLNDHIVLGSELLIRHFETKSKFALLFQRILRKKRNLLLIRR